MSIDWSFVLYERPILDDKAKPHYAAKKLDFMKSIRFHMKLGRFHMKSLKTADSIEIIHFLLLFHRVQWGANLVSIKMYFFGLCMSGRFHMKSGGFHMKPGRYHENNGLERSVQSPNNQVDLVRILGILGTDAANTIHFIA